MKDMTAGKPAKILFLFAMPMILGNVFQQLYNIVDSVVVGNFVGAEALAAVGASFPITFLFVSIAIGAGTGCSVIISQRFGAKRMSEVKTGITTALITIVGIGIVVMGLGLLINSPILNLMNTPANIFEDAGTYLRIYFFGIAFLFLYNVLTAIFNALGDSKTPLVFLIISSIINIGLDLLFVIKFNMGVAGVAWATLISQGISSLLSFSCLMIRLNKIQVDEPSPIYSLDILKSMSVIAIPSIIQQSIVSVGMLFVQTLVNGYGSNIVAGYTAATKIDSIAMMPMINISNAMSTFTAQNIGAKKSERVRDGLKAALIMVAVISISISIILNIWGSSFVGLFVDSVSNQAVIDVGAKYLSIVSIFYVIMGILFTCNGLLKGAGDVGFFMTTTLSNFACRVGFAYLLSYWIGSEAIWWSIPIGWIVGGTLSSLRYRSGKWDRSGGTKKA